MKTKKLVFTREDFTSKDDEGNYFVSQIGLDEFGNEVSQWHACDKPGCNCVGGWEFGNSRDAQYNINRLRDDEQTTVFIKNGIVAKIVTEKI